MIGRKLLSMTLALLFLSGCATSSPALITPVSTANPTVTATPIVVERSMTLAYYSSASLHPITSDNPINLMLAGLVYEGLFSISPTFESSPALCIHYTVSEDGLTWTFYLDSTAKFSDGSKVTSADIIYSLSLAQESTLYGTRLTEVRSIEATEDGVADGVVVTLSAPVGDFTLLLDIPIVREQIAADDQGDLPPLGTGLYFFDGLDSTLYLSSTSANCDDIDLYPITTSGELIYGFETQNISVVSTDATGSGQLSFSGTYETHLYPTSELLFVGFEMEDGPCADPALRQLLQLAFDRDYISVSLLARQLTTASLPISPSSDLYNHTLADTLSYDSQAVAQGLAELGWTANEEGYLAKDEEVLTLDLVVYGDNQSQTLVGSYLADALGDLGILVNLRTLSWAEYLTALENGDFDLYLGETRLTATFDISTVLTEDGALNFGGYVLDEEAQGFLDAFHASTTVTATTYTNLYTYLIQNPAFVTLGFSNWSLLTQWDAFDSPTPTQQNVFYQLEDWTIPSS